MERDLFGYPILPEFKILRIPYIQVKINQNNSCNIIF